MTAAIRVILKRGRSKPFWVGHPWVFSGAIHRVDGTVGEMGGPCVVVDERDNILGSGFYNPHAKIAVRLLEHRRSTDLDFAPRPLPELVSVRLASALARRRALGLPADDTTAYRVCHGEGDLLGGLVIDRMGPLAVMHLQSRAMYEQRQVVADIVADVLGLESVMAVVDEKHSKLEAIPTGTEVLVGGALSPVEVLEAGVKYHIDAARGFKTAFHTEQRDNRRRFAALTVGQDVLDMCCGAGGFGLHAALTGARSVVAVDVSEPASVSAAKNAKLNGVDGVMNVHCSDVMVFLKEARAAGRTWSRLVCDPPDFARGRGHLKDALKKLARLNTLAFASLEPGGVMLTCTGSPHVSGDGFLRVLTDAGHRLRRGVHVHGVWGQAPDHPFAAVAPEGRSLTAVLLSLE